MGKTMGQSEERRTRGIITILKFWVIRLAIGSAVAMSAKKVDSYLDRKYGPADYDKRIVEIWNSVKNLF